MNTRICNITLQEMTEGWYCELQDVYIKYEDDAIEFVRKYGYDDLESAFNDDFIYYTEWAE